MNGNEFCDLSGVNVRPKNTHLLAALVDEDVLVARVRLEQVGLPRTLVLEGLRLGRLPLVRNVLVLLKVREQLDQEGVVLVKLDLFTATGIAFEFGGLFCLDWSRPFPAASSTPSLVNERPFRADLAGPPLRWDASSSFERKLPSVQSKLQKYPQIQMCETTVPKRVRRQPTVQILLWAREHFDLCVTDGPLVKSASNSNV